MKKRCRRFSCVENASDRQDTSPPASRAAWTGCIRVGSIIAPVRGYASVMDDSEPQLHQLHRKCGERIQCPRVCPKHGTLASEDIVKGLDVGSGEHIVLAEESLKRRRPPKDEELVLERFVADSDIDPVLFSGRHLYLTPTSSASAVPFNLIVTVLGKLRKSGVGQLTINGRTSVVAVTARGPRLAMHFLHYSTLIRSVPEFEPAESKSSFGSALVETFVDKHNSRIDWSSFHDPAPEIMEELIAEARTRKNGGRKRQRRNTAPHKRDRCNPAKTTTGSRATASRRAAAGAK